MSLPPGSSRPTRAPSSGGRPEDTIVPVIVGAALLAAFGPAVIAAVKRWAVPRLRRSSNAATRVVGNWWDANWWLVGFWLAAAVMLVVYRWWVRRRARFRGVQAEVLATGLVKVMGRGWNAKQHLRIRRWRGTRPVVVRAALTGQAPVADREWRLTVSSSARELLGRIEPVVWPDALTQGTTSWRRVPWVTLRAVVPPTLWQRLLARLWRGGRRRSVASGGSDVPPAAAAAAVEERLVAALAGLVPQPRPKVDGSQIVVGYSETTRDQSPAWRSRVVDQVSARLGSAYRSSWDRQARRFTLEPVPALPHPILWTERAAVLRQLAVNGWVAGYGTDENGNIVAWEPGDREPHALLTGDPGTGKTEAMKALIETLLLLGVMVAIIDPKQRDFAEFLGRPGVVCVATAVEDQVGALVDLEGEMMRRTAASALRRLERQYPDLEDGRYHSGRPAQAAIDEVPLVVVLDELTMHTQQVQEWWQRLTPPEKADWGAEKSRTAPMLTIPSRIVALARAIKIHMLIGVQRADATNFGGSSTMRDNIKHMASMGQQSPIGSEMQWGDRRTGSEVEVEHPGEGMSNGLRISPDTGERLGRGIPGRFKAWYAADTAETDEFWAEVAQVAPDASLVRLPHVSDAARIPAAAAAALRRQAYADALVAVPEADDPAVPAPVGAVDPDDEMQAEPLTRTLRLVPTAADDSVDNDSLTAGRDPVVEGEADPLLAEAAALVVRRKQGSAAMLQRELRVGYERGRLLMEQLEAQGVVGPVQGRKARTVLATTEELDRLLAGPAGAARRAGGASAAPVIPPVSLAIAAVPDGVEDEPEVDARGLVWSAVVPASLTEGDTVQFGDIAAGRLLEDPELVVDEFDGAELVRLLLDVAGEEQVIDLSEDEVIYRVGE